MITIGYANATLKLSFITTVWDSFQAAAEQQGDVNVIMRDNDMDNERSFANMDEFADMGVDLVITCHVDERSGPEAIRPLIQKNIPVISLEIPIRPFSTFFGIDNHAAGTMLGEAVGDWVNRHWDGQVDKVLVMGDYRITGLIRERCELSGESFVASVGLDKDNILMMDGGNLRETSAENAYQPLKVWGQDTRIAVLGINDDSGLGVLDAAMQLGIEENVIVGGHGATLGVEQLTTPGSRFVATTDFSPKTYGDPMLALALRILNGDKVPANNLLKPILLTHDDF